MGVALEDSYQSESQRREVGQLDSGELKKRKEKNHLMSSHQKSCILISSF